MSCQLEIISNTCFPVLFSCSAILWPDKPSSTSTISPVAHSQVNGSEANGRRYPLVQDDTGHIGCKPQFIDDAVFNSLSLTQTLRTLQSRAGGDTEDVSSLSAEDASSLHNMLTTLARIHKVIRFVSGAHLGICWSIFSPLDSLQTEDMTAMLQTTLFYAMQGRVEPTTVATPATKTACMTMDSFPEITHKSDQELVTEREQESLILQLYQVRMFF